MAAIFWLLPCLSLACLSQVSNCLSCACVLWQHFFLCAGVIPSGVIILKVTNNSAVIRWNSVSPFLNTYNIYAYSDVYYVLLPPPFNSLSILLTPTHPPTTFPLLLTFLSLPPRLAHKQALSGGMRFSTGQHPAVCMSPSQCWVWGLHRLPYMTSVPSQSTWWL